MGVFVGRKVRGFKLFLNALRLWLRKRQGYLLSVYALIEKENSIQESSMIFANKVVSRDN